MPAQIGPYQVIHEIGRGGMGVVSLARDERLDRDVAIKALPEEFASDPARLERFRREARTLAGLSHPNIAGIYGVEEQDDRKYLILEYVQGETLGERLDQGPIPVDEAIEIAIEIAKGVEAAHDAGVIHRDLKPDNIKITPDGHVKVLDFGIAKVAATAGSSTNLADSPTVTIPHSPTMPGAILGTAAYMSPEQARGRKADKRVDIWAFGVILYEMLAGASPFAGESPSDSIGAVLHKDIDLDQLPPGTPVAVRRVIERCLVRNKDLRYRDIGDVRLELLALDDARQSPASMARPPIGVVSAIAAIAVAVGGTAAWFLKPVPAAPPTPLVQADITLPEGMRLSHELISSIAISPDGQTIVYPVGDPQKYANRERFNRGLMIRRLDQDRATSIGGADQSLSPAISPDGSTIAYVRMSREFGARGVMTVPMTGGTPRPIGEIRWTPFGLTWSEGGRIVIGSLHGLDAIGSSGGSISPLTIVDRERDEYLHASPHALPGDRGVLFTVVSLAGEVSLWIVDPAGERRKLLDNGSHPQFVNGHMLFARRGGLYAVPLDLDTRRVAGEVRPLGIDLVHSIYSPNSMTRSGMAQYAVARSGNLVFAKGSVYPPHPRPAVWVDRDGVETPIDVPTRPYLSARLSPDGSRAILTVSYDPQAAVWELIVARGIQQRVFAGAVAWALPGQGDRVILTEDRGDGSSGVSLVDRGAPVIRPAELGKVHAAQWVPEGEQLLGVRTDPTSEIVTWTEDAGLRVVVSDGEARYRWPTVSPDGRWLAYASDVAGRDNVYVRPFGRDGTTVLVSGESAEIAPAWSADGSELYYRDATSGWMMGVTVTVEQGRIEFGRPTQLFDATGYAVTFPLRSWDVAPDGRFLMLRRLGEDERITILNTVFPDRLRLVQGWARTLAD